MGLFRSIFGGQAGPPVEGVNAQELNDLLQSDQEFLLVDVRSPMEYEHDGHITGARLMPLQMLLQRAAELPQDKEIVFVCRSGNRSMVACEQMKRLGFSNVKNFDGGMIAWNMAGLPLE
ncbi:MAG: rhodanese-like domain-containing protein [Candidatus Promineifilaceae bacterium]|jgi:rhodanese-related sulfurtransferase